MINGRALRETWSLSGIIGTWFLNPREIRQNLQRSKSWIQLLLDAQSISAPLGSSFRALRMVRTRLLEEDGQIQSVPSLGSKVRPLAMASVWPSERALFGSLI